MCCFEEKDFQRLKKKLPVFRAEICSQSFTPGSMSVWTNWEATFLFHYSPFLVLWKKNSNFTSQHIIWNYVDGLSSISSSYITSIQSTVTSCICNELCNKPLIWVLRRKDHPQLILASRLGFISVLSSF